MKVRRRHRGLILLLAVLMVLIMGAQRMNQLKLKTLRKMRLKLPMRLKNLHQRLSLPTQRKKKIRFFLICLTRT